MLHILCIAYSSPYLGRLPGCNGCVSGSACEVAGYAFPARHMGELELGPCQHNFLSQEKDGSRGIVITTVVYHMAVSD